MQTTREIPEIGEASRWKASFPFMARLSVSFLLSACTTDSVPDEEFEAPTGNFPLLGTVPDRLAFQPQQDIACRQDRLQRERDETIQKQAKIVRSITP